MVHAGGASGRCVGCGVREGIWWVAGTDRRVGCGVMRAARRSAPLLSAPAAPSPASACGGSMALTTGPALHEQSATSREGSASAGGGGAVGTVMKRVQAPFVTVLSQFCHSGDGWRLDGRRARTDGVGGGERKPIADPPAHGLARLR